ncbi:MAG: FAD:protein FMN transferase [Propionibacteriaceae bacterium]|nr:FAD:protein FMN transferase [Propionibacteriaceae bacterium]
MTPDPSVQERWSESTAMGTTVHLCLVDEESAVGRAGAPAPLHALVAEVDAALSRFRPTSDVGRLNAASGSWLPVGAHLAAVAEASERWRILTEGSFDAVTGVGPEPRLRVRATGAQRWEAWLAPGCRLDFGAIAKGYAADLVRDRATAAGLLVSLGTSSISVSGRPPGREHWRIAIGSPWEALPETLGYLRVDSGSFSMSGLRGQRLRPGQVVVGHLRDPATNTWARTDVCAVGVLSEDGMRSEALSTACLVQGLERGMALSERLGSKALFLTVSGRLIASPGMAALISLRAGVSGRLRELRELLLNHHGPT